jgi:outer membrane cobalamin receptor
VQKLVAAGDRYADPANTVRLGGFALLKFYADDAVALGSTILGRITNALDRRYELARLRHGGSP